MTLSNLRKINKSDNDIDRKINNIFNCFISPDIDKPFHFLWNAEDSYKNWYNCRFYFLEKEILLFSKKNSQANYREDLYLVTNDFKSSILNKSYKHCALMGRAYEENISFNLEFVKIITKLKEDKTSEIKRITIQSSSQDMKIPIYVGYHGVLPDGNIIILDQNNPGGYFLPNKAIKKFVTCKLDKTYTYPKYKEFRKHSHHISFNSIPVRYTKNLVIPQFLTIDLDLNYKKNKFIIDSKKTFIPLDVPILIAYLSNFSLKHIQNIISIKFDEYVNLILDVIFENSKNILNEFVPENKEKYNNILVEKRKIEAYISKVVTTCYAKDKKNNLKQISRQEYFNNIFNNFIPHMKEKKHIDKAFYLIIIVEHFLTAIFQRSIYPDKDHLSTRRIASLGSIYESIMVSAIDTCINDIKNQIDKEKSSSSTIEQIIKRIKPITKFQNSFNNFFNMQDKKHSTTVKLTTGSNYLQNIIIPNMSVWESKIKLTKNLDARDPNISSFSTLGPVDTPEHSDNVALHRRVTIGTKISYFDINTHAKIFEELENYIKIKTNKFYDQFGVHIVIVDESEHYITTIQNSKIEEFVKKLKKDKIENKFITKYIDIGLIPIYYEDELRKILLPSKNYRLLRINIGNRVPYMPYFIIENGKLLVDEFNIKQEDFKSFTRLINKYPIIEFLGPEQRTYSNICESIDEFKNLNELERKKYNYMMFPSTINFGVLECMLYDIGRMPGARGIFGTAQQKKIITGPCSDILNKFEPSKFLSLPYQKPCITNSILIKSNIASNGTGVHLNVAFISKNTNVEDALIINKDAIDNGALSMISLNIVKGEMSSTQINTPDPYKINNSYKKLNAIGVPDIGNVLEYGDALYKNVSPMIKDEKTYSYDTSEPYKNIIPGKVERMFRVGSDTIQLKYIISTIHKITKGDKLTTRAAQKGTIAKIENPQNLPYTKDGIKPSLIMNSTGLLSRKTINMYIEVMLTKMFGFIPYDNNKVLSLIEYLPFSNLSIEEIENYIYNNLKNIFPDKNEKEIKDILKCKEILYDPYTHKSYKNPVFFGPILYCRLPEISSEKISVRDKGKLNKIDQPPAGKKKGGSGRTGEMEVDIIATHGAAMILNEISNDVQDAQSYSMVCTRCGNFATLEKTPDYKRFYCLHCETNGFTSVIIKIKLTKAVKMMIQLLNFRGINLIIKEDYEKNIYPIDENFKN